MEKFFYTDENGNQLLTEDGGSFFVGEGWDGVISAKRYPLGPGLRYIVSDGDTLESIVWKQYARRDAAAINQVLAANMGIADLGPELPAGWVVALPDLAQVKSETAVLRLWN